MEAEEIVQERTNDSFELKCEEYPHFFSLYGVQREGNEVDEHSDVNSKNCKQHGTEKPEHCMELICSNLNALSEELFRNFITKKFNSCSIRHDEGNLCTIDFRLTEYLHQPMICYYVKLTKPTTIALSENVDVENESNLSQEFVVCFLTSSEVNLEFFRSELHLFCKGLMSSLDSDLAANRDNPVLAAELETWYHVSIKYLCRCIQLLGSDIAILFFLAATDGNLEIQDAEIEICEDINKFLTSCGITEMMRFSVESKENAKNHVTPKATLKFETDNISYKLSGVVCDQYCKEWASLILDGEKENPMFLKRVMENFKLATVQSMNTFKRLLLDAESDYYALFKAFVFLRNSKQGTVLLQQAKLQDSFALSRNAVDVITVLENFIII